VSNLFLVLAEDASTILELVVSGVASVVRRDELDELRVVFELAERGPCGHISGEASHGESSFHHFRFLFFE